jgi:metal-responsive CopG/Arc/MetJ family transcriptional regulator
LAVTVTTRVEKDLAEAIDEIAREEGMDRSTVVRRFLSRAVRDWLTSKSLERYEAGSITLWQAAGQCGLSLWDIVEEARRRKVHSPYSLQELEEDLRAL